MTQLSKLPLKNMAPSTDWSPPSETAQMFTLIQRLAMEPEANLDKMDRLLAMKERLDAQQAQRDFNSSMAQAQSQMPAIVARQRNAHTKSTYADLASIYAVAKPVTTGLGLSFSTWPADSTKADHIGVKWILRHGGGHNESGHADIPVDSKGAKGNDNKTATHAVGSSFTYARRYLFCMLFDIAIGKDDDGNAGGGSAVATISAERYIQIRDLAEELNVSEEIIATDAGVSDLQQLPVSMFQKVINKLNETKRLRKVAAEKSLTVNLGEEQ